jgi:hypothetical protein
MSLKGAAKQKPLTPVSEDPKQDDAKKDDRDHHKKPKKVKRN